MFNAARDAFTSKAVQAFINQRIARYGEVQRLKLDSANKTAEVVCRLLGEEQPITVSIGRYEVGERDGRPFVRLVQCTSNRAWLQNLLDDFGAGKEFPLPPWAASAL